MAGEWRGQNLRKTVGECEIEVGRHKHMHETRQCSSVLLQGTDATVPERCLLLPVEGWESVFSPSLLLLLLLMILLLSLSFSLSVTLGVVGGQLCLARSLVEVSL